MRFIFRCLSRFPLHLLHNLGGVVGWLVYGLSPAYRRHFSENWAVAGMRAHRKEAIAEAGKTILELPKLWMRPPQEVANLVVRVSGWPLVDAAQQAGRGIIFLTPHLGCYEISAQYVAQSFPITVLYRKPKQSWLVPLMEEGRGSTLQLASADLSGVRRLMKALKAGQAIGILPDQVPGQGEGVWASFFGRPAWTMTLVSKLAKSSQATVLLAFAERLSYGAGYHLQFFTPEGDVNDAPALNHNIERLIRLSPAQYLWGYNRYKRPQGVPLP